MLKMSKICCVGDANVCPKSSSCSMVLRSACSHRHSCESLTVKEHLHLRASSPSRRKHSSSITKKVSCNGNLHVEGVELSQKRLILESDENSLLKGPYYHSFEFSDSESQKRIETSLFNVSCIKELSFSHLSTSSDSSLYEHANYQKCSSGYSSAAESDVNSRKKLECNSKMSSSRRFTRSTASSARSLSCSEDEDDISVRSIVRPLIIANNNLTRPQISHQEANYENLYSNHSSHNQGPDTTYTDGSSDAESLSHFSDFLHSSRLAIPNSLFHKFRWSLWSYIYSQIIKMSCIDSWLLTRFHNFGKLKSLFLLFLSFLLFCWWCIIPHSESTIEALSQPLNSFTSSVLYLSSIFSSVFGYFVQMCPQSIYPTWFVNTEESAPLLNEKHYTMKDPVYDQTERPNIIQSNTEEIKLLHDEINLLKALLKTNVQETEAGRISHLEKELKLQNEIKNLQLEFQSLTSTVGSLEKEMENQSEKNQAKEDIVDLTNKYKSQIDHLKLKLNAIEEKLIGLEGLKNCCDKQWKEEDFLAFLEKHLILAFKNVMDGDSDPNSKYHFFNSWLSSKLSSHERKLMQLIDTMRKEATSTNNEMNYDKVMNIVESTVLKYVDSLKRNLSKVAESNYSGFDLDKFWEDKVKQIVKEAIMLYDADKIGKVDYALESGGGSVVGTRCTETYIEKYGTVSIFGVPLWTNSNSPRTAIQPDVQPGHCWAFKGSQGFLVIELSATIHPTGFTLEHIPLSLSRTGSIDSAPKNFSVWGLDSEKDNKGTLLGEYWYDISGEPLQYFALQKPSDRHYSYVELQIHSNHGNMEYTCLYRFRVHGKRSKTN